MTQTMSSAATAPTTQEPVLDAGKLVDDATLTGFHFRVLAFAAMAIILDGVDVQVLGFAAPSLMADWGVSKAALAPVLAVGLFGMMIGTTVGGILGDKFGRRIALLACLATFGLATAAMALADTITALFLLRLVAGCGMGGLMPNAFSLVAEFSPLRRRTILLTACIVCVPAGGVIGGLLAASLLPTIGWRGLLAVAGCAPLLLAACLFFLLPESPRFLAERMEGWAKLSKLLPRLGIPIPDKARFAMPSRQVRRFGSPAELLSPEYRRDTMLLWTAFFLCLAAVFLNFHWLPSMLVGAGYSVEVASAGLLAFNFGGVAAALVAAWVISYTGSRLPLFLMAIGAAAVALVLYFFPPAPVEFPITLLVGLALVGIGSSGLQALLYTLASNMYPTGIRATGMGSAASMGRVGAIAITFVGAGVLARFGETGFYMTIVITLFGTAVALINIRKHVPKSGRLSEEI
jgi:AAHS family 4-hydroxybenzoate transporter-like MFS transporter